MTNDFETRLAALDATLFQHVLSQMPEEDQRSLLALQAAVRARHRQFVYLEIGSYLGGPCNLLLWTRAARKSSPLIRA